ncbi:MAG TPA: sigma-70 family RNA polymerase sigma factor [Solirubrobacterales bacterium]|jgi:RNA polymerase sigma-70 factor (ECF subfamily)|nr:sigma-70 family RNA polymerase sigma factor [Solirubrobacterales bacterium]
MTEGDTIVSAFEEQRPHLRAVAYRMLGSTGEADDAVQEAWLRLSRSDAAAIENLGGWLTTVVARICLNMLRSRNSRREQPLDLHVPDPIVDPLDGTDPEHEALLADSVGIAMLMVLEQLSPAERLAFVLHDMFGVPFDEIAPIVDRTPDAARQLASRGRRRLRAADPDPAPDFDAQREVVEAFVAAAREGDFDRLVNVLHPDVVLRADFGPDREAQEVRGVEAVIARARTFASMGARGHLVRVNGGVGTVAFMNGKPFSVGAVRVREGRIVEIDFLGDPARLAKLDLSWLEG